jgi:hypothetical protein
MGQYSISPASRRIVVSAFGFVALGYVSNGLSARQCEIAAAQRVGNEISGPAHRIEGRPTMYVTAEDMSRHPVSGVVLLRAGLAVRPCTAQHVNTDCWPRAFVARSEWIVPWIVSVHWGWQSGPGVEIQRTTRGRGARTRFFTFFGECVRLWDETEWYKQST